MTATAAALLQQRLGLSDDELLRILDEEPLTVLAGELDHKPELAILLALTEEAAESAGEGAGRGGLRPWGPAPGPRGRPADPLLPHAFPAFEDALVDLRERGF